MKQPIIKFNNKKHWYSKNTIELVKPFSVKLGSFVFTLKKGFDSDGASIPRFLWWASNPFDSQTLPAALIHDMAYWTNIFPRRMADKLFLIIMEQYKTPLIKRYAFWCAVRCFGWICYYSHKKPTKQEIDRYLHIK